MNIALQKRNPSFVSHYSNMLLTRHEVVFDIKLWGGKSPEGSRFRGLYAELQDDMDLCPIPPGCAREGYPFLQEQASMGDDARNRSTSAWILIKITLGEVRDASCAPDSRGESKDLPPVLMRSDG
jgi:hypothetical protein